LVDLSCLLVITEFLALDVTEFQNGWSAVRISDPTLRDVDVQERHEDFSNLKSTQTPHYDLDEVQSVRNGLKLSTKLLMGDAQTWGPNRSLKLSCHAAEVGLLLALAGQTSEVVNAGLLHQAQFDANNQIAFDIERKMGSDTFNLCRKSKEFLITSTRDVSQLSECQEVNAAATIHCAVTVASLGAGFVTLNPLEVRDLSEKYIQCGVPPMIRDQFTLETDLSLPVDNNIYGSNHLTAEDVVTIRNSFRFAAWLFANVDRGWGPLEKLPLTSHAAEVGTILALGRASRDLIIAGFLHDSLERYVKVETNHIRDILFNAFGDRVLRLVEGVTEPIKTDLPGNWLDRKLSILSHVENGDVDLATLCCATKISTIAAGNKWLWTQGGEIKGWSSGSLEDNIVVFERLRDVFVRKGVAEIFISQYDSELSRFKASRDATYLSQLKSNKRHPSQIS